MSEFAIFPFIFNALWQSALFAATVWAMVRVLKIENAATTTLLWSAAFFLSVATPFASFAQSGNANITFNVNAPQAVIPIVAPSLDLEQTTSLTPASSIDELSVLKGIATILVIIWFAGSAWRTLRLIRDALVIANLRSRSTPLSSEGGPISLPTDISLRSHRELIIPIAAGIFRPAIILPQETANNLRSDAAKSAIAHELAHIKRGDLIWSFAEAVVLCIFWWNPMIWKIRAALADNREMACDDYAVRLVKNAETYAQSLIDYAERSLLLRSNAHHAALAASGNPSKLSERITRLMPDDYTHRTRLSISKALLAGTTVAVLSVCVATAAPRIVVETVVSTAPRAQQAEPSSNEDALGRNLVRAITESQWYEADALIAAGADVNAVLEGDGTPLIAAVNSHSTDYAEKLISLGADVNADAIYDETALIAAVMNGDLNMTRLLINSGANVNQSSTTETGSIRSPLGEAKRRKHSQIEAALRNAGATG